MYVEEFVEWHCQLEEPYPVVSFVSFVFLIEIGKQAVRMHGKQRRRD